LFSYLNNAPTDLPFFTQERGLVTHEQSIICSRTHLDANTQHQTFICRQLFAGKVVEGRKEGKNALNAKR